MEYRTLGRTGLCVSRIGLGSGGPSRLGQATGRSSADIRGLVRLARDLGVNLFDTAPGYGDAEAILGRALVGERREDLVLATKASPKLYWGPLAGLRFRRSVEQSLRRLQVETIDLLQFHSVRPGELDGVIDRLLPVAERLRDRGWIRFIGITEAYSRNTEHATVRRALATGRFDTVMAGVHLLDQSAAAPVFAECDGREIGGLAMFVVRRILRDAASFRAALEELAAAGAVRPALAEADAPLEEILGRSVPSIPALAYRYVASLPGVTAVLTGTSRPEHLRANVEAVLRPPLAAGEMAALHAAFGSIPGPVAG